MNFIIAKTYEKARRSTRIRAQIPVRVTSLDASIGFSEQCSTVIVNTQGCGVRLSRSLEPGIAVRLDELPIEQLVTARVANCVPLGNDNKYWLVGLALDQPGNVWGIHSAPADWGESKAAAAAAAATPTPVPAKPGEWPYSVFSSKGEAHPGRK